MILPIDDEYRIASDRHQWMIQRARQRTRNGKSVLEWWFESSYPTFEGAVRELGERLVRESEAQGFTEALVDVKRVCARLSRALPTHIRLICESGEFPEKVRSD